MIGFHITFNYITVAHTLLTYERTYCFYSHVYCFGHVLFLVIMVLPLGKWFRVPKEKKDQ